METVEKNRTDNTNWERFKEDFLRINLSGGTTWKYSLWELFFLLHRHASVLNMIRLIWPEKKRDVHYSWTLLMLRAVARFIAAAKTIWFTLVFKRLIYLLEIFAQSLALEVRRERQVKETSEGEETRRKFTCGPPPPNYFQIFYTFLFCFESRSTECRLTVCRWKWFVFRAQWLWYCHLMTHATQFINATT